MFQNSSLEADTHKLTATTLVKPYKESKSIMQFCDVIIFYGVCNQYMESSLDTTAQAHFGFISHEIVRKRKLSVGTRGFNIRHHNYKWHLQPTVLFVCCCFGFNIHIQITHRLP